MRVTRLAGAASRLMMAYQQGLVTLDRLRAGGKQTIIVQHVQVNEGGQAVVAGMKPGEGWGSWRGGVSLSPNRPNEEQSQGEGSEMTAEPHVPRRWRTAGNAAPRCGARRRHDGSPCQQPGNGQWAVPLSWREEHGAEDAGGR